MHSIRFMAGIVSTAVLSLFSHTTKLGAQGLEGDRFFPPTIQTEDPFAVDELSLPVVSVFHNPAGEDGPKTREIDLSVEFDKEIFPKFALGISASYIGLQPQGEPYLTGFDNSSLSAKYQLFENAPHEFIFSVGGEVD